MKLEFDLTERRRGAVGHVVVPRKTTTRHTPGEGDDCRTPSRHSSSAPARASRRMTARGVAPASSTRVDDATSPLGSAATSSGPWRGRSSSVGVVTTVLVILAALARSSRAPGALPPRLVSRRRRRRIASASPRSSAPTWCSSAPRERAQVWGWATPVCSSPSTSRDPTDRSSPPRAPELPPPTDPGSSRYPPARRLRSRAPRAHPRRRCVPHRAQRRLRRGMAVLRPIRHAVHHRRRVRRRRRRCRLATFPTFASRPSS